MEQLKIVPAHELLPCTEEEVRVIEEQLKLRLPEAYRSFLLWMGHGAGRLMQGLDCFYEHLLDFQSKARFLLAQHECRSSIPEDAFIFFMLEDRCFSFIRTSEGDNPPIYTYNSGWRHVPFRKIYHHFNNFLAIEIEMLEDFLTGDKTLLPEVKSRLEALQHHNAGAIFSVSEKRHGVEF